MADLTVRAASFEDEVGMRLRVTNRVLADCGECCTELVLFGCVEVRFVYCSVLYCTGPRFYTCVLGRYIYQRMFDDEGRND